MDSRKCGHGAHCCRYINQNSLPAQIAGRLRAYFFFTRPVRRVQEEGRLMEMMSPLLRGQVRRRRRRVEAESGVFCRYCE